MNINRNNNDNNYRYKMPKLVSRLCGRGNGSFTILDNLTDISETLNTPFSILFNFIARSLGSSCNEDKKSITGHYQTDELIEQIYKFIEFFVLCQKCFIPELTVEIMGSKKKKHLNVVCSACGNSMTLTSNSKIFDKTIEHFIKYYEKNTFTIKKGNMVEQEITNENLFNPF